MSNFFSDLQLAIVEEPNIERALKLAHIYGNICWYADVGIYDNPIIEKSVIGKALKLREGSAEPTGQLINDSLHIVTEAYLSGGHTRLMEKLATMHVDKPDVLIVRGATREVKKRLEKYFRCVVQTEVSSVRALLAQLVDIMCTYKNVILHLHPDDIPTVAACGVVKKLKVGTKFYFVNHADHVFSYGSSIADVYFQISSFGERIDKYKTIVGEKSFLGIPVDGQKKPSESVERIDRLQPLKFMSAGSDIKFRPSHGLDIRPLVKEILNTFPRSQFWIVGPNFAKDYWFWFLKVRYCRRFFVRRSLPFDRYKELTETVDFYIDSHPLPGGTGFAEQFLSGKKCAGLVSPVQGYSAADNLKKLDVDKVVDAILCYGPTLEFYAQVLQTNGYESVKKRYLDCLYSGILSQNVIAQFCEWQGDEGFFRIGLNPLDANLSTGIFLELQTLNPRLAIKLYGTLSWQKKIKLCLKIVILKCKNVLLRC